MEPIGPTTVGPDTQISNGCYLQIQIIYPESVAINIIIDGVGHYRQNVQCMFAAYTNATPLPGQLQAIDISPFILLVPGLASWWI